MRSFTKEQLTEIIRLHGMWLRNEDGGVSADLSYADLSYANLSEIHLNFAIGERRFVKTMQIESYMVTYTAKRLFIGCKNYLIEDWKSFSDADIRLMDGKDALDFWRKWKEIIFKIIEISPAEEVKVEGGTK